MHKMNMIKKLNKMLCMLICVALVVGESTTDSFARISRHSSIALDLVEPNLICVSWTAAKGETAKEVYYQKEAVDGTLSESVSIAVEQNTGEQYVHVETGETYHFTLVTKKDTDRWLYSHDSKSIYIFGEVNSRLNVSRKSQWLFYLSWDKVPGATDYDIYYRVSGEEWKRFTTIDHNNLKFSIASKYLNADYSVDEFYFRIRPYHRGRDGTITEWGTMSDSYTLISKNTLRVSRNNKISVKLTWNKGRGKKDGYEIYRATSANGNWKKIKTVSASAERKAIIVQSVRGKRYYYKILPYEYVNGRKICGPASNIKSIKL